MLATETFKPSNELTFFTVQPDSIRLIKFLEDNVAAAIRLDLNDVTLCDSAGLALLIEAKRLCNQANKPLEIDGVSKAIYALAEFCGVEGMLVRSESVAK